MSDAMQTNPYQDDQWRAAQAALLAAAKVTRPSVGLLQGKTYTPASNTDIRRTFAAARKA